MEIQQDNIHQPAFLGIKDAANLTGLSVSTLYRWCEEKKCPHHKVGKRVLFKCEEILAFMEQFHVKATRAEELVR